MHNVEVKSRESVDAFLKEFRREDYLCLPQTSHLTIPAGLEFPHAGHVHHSLTVIALSSFC